jgi:hypothetical protein
LNCRAWSIAGNRMKKALFIASTIISAPSLAFDVPVADLAAWKTLSYWNISANAVTVNDEALHIAVRKSASPLVYKMVVPLTVTAVTIDASWDGELRIPANTVQGERGADDFVLKFGVVEAGGRTLNWLQRQIAPGWAQQLFKLAPAGTGVGRINFLSTTQQPELLGSTRVHPLNDLLYETRVTYLPSVGEFSMSYRFPEPVEVLGLWISADGDDTASSFDLQIRRITLHSE